MKRIDVSSVPVDFVHNVVQVAEVYQMKMVKAQKSVEKDVIIITPLGKTANIDRLTLVNNFLTLSGKPIKLISLRYNKTYTIMRTKKTSCLAVEIPKSDKVEFVDAEGNKFKGGLVLTVPVANVEVTGDVVDFSQANKVPKPLFKKIYQITKLSDAFMERLNIAKEAREEANRLEKERLEAEDNANRAEAQRKANIEREAKENKAVEDAFRDKRGSLPVVERKHTESVDTRGEVTAIVVDENDKLVGYKVKLSNGKLFEYTPQQVASLAQRGELMNVKFVPADIENGRAAYLAGVGVSLKELPRVPIGY